MYIKQLIKDNKSYWEYVWQFLDWTLNPERSLWRPEDYPKLELFFNNQRNSDWSKEVKESFDFYEKCRKEYGERNTELRDSVRQFSPEDVLEAFGYELPAYEDEDTEYSKDTPLRLDEDFDATFPFVVVGELSSGWDRGGNIRIAAINFVSLTDFVDYYEQ